MKAKKAFLTALFLTVAIISIASLVYFIIQKFILQSETLADFSSGDIRKTLVWLLMAIVGIVSFRKLRIKENKSI